MIPSTVGFLDKDFEIAQQPGMTYRMQTGEKRVRGYTDGRETERYQYAMYSWNYGIELIDLLGEPVTYVCPELKRRITEALLWDNRIKSVDDFQFTFSQRGAVHVAFTAHTVYGDVPAEREVKF